MTCLMGMQLRCDACETLQHTTCYGYWDTSALPPNESHVCYVCLLGTHQTAALDQAADLVLQRRAVKIAHDHGYSKVVDLARDLGACSSTRVVDLANRSADIDLKTADKLSRSLRSRGYVSEAPGSHSKGFSQSGKPKYIVNHGEPSLSTVLRDLFDPKKDIAAHVRSTFRLPSLATNQN